MTLVDYVLDADHVPIQAVLGQGMVSADAQAVANAQAALRAVSFCVASYAVAGQLVTLTLNGQAPVAGTLRIDWGDGAITSLALGAGSIVATPAHTYVGSGVWDVSLSYKGATQPAWPKSTVAPQAAKAQVAVGWPPAPGSMNPLIQAAFVAAHPPR